MEMLMRLLLLALFASAAFAACFPNPDNIKTDTGVNDPDVSEDVAQEAGPDIALDTAVDLNIPDTPEIRLNACGGEGNVDPAPPGGTCGPCNDGLYVCDPTDTAKNRVICSNASEKNTCGGCGLIAPALGTDCDECGTISCDGATGGTHCVEPTEGCDTFLTCTDLDCATTGRACVPAVEADATCGACLAGWSLLTDRCVQDMPSPLSVVATTTDADKVVVAWAAVSGARVYRVERCDVASCASGDWQSLPNNEVAGLSYDDTSASAGGPPLVVEGVSASTNDAIKVVIAWSGATVSAGESRKYRVFALSVDTESPPSVTVTGARAAQPLTGYEVSVDDGPWIAIVGGAVARSWNYTDAPAPTLRAGTASASEGAYSDRVALSLTGEGATDGLSRDYSVRAVSVAGSGAAGVEVNGYRRAPQNLAITWERSSGSSAETFALLADASGRSWDDRTAPSDGSVRFYRGVVSGQGAAAARTTAVSGSRLPPPGVPSAVSATSDREDLVRVSWQAVDSALGYHIYRDGSKLTTGNGVTTTSYDDSVIGGPTAQWAAPSGLTASTNDQQKVVLSWTAPTRPTGPAGSYQVQAVNPSGTSALSGTASGRRARPALISYEVETHSSWFDLQSLSTIWNDLNGPSGVITPGTIVATKGDHRAHTKLNVSGHSVSPKSVVYRVRGILEGGAKTPTSAIATGARAVGALTLQWERSSTAVSTSAFAAIATATTVEFLDTAAPNNGEKRWYKLRLSASGAPEVMVAAVEGWRLAIVKVSASDKHTCALAADGSIWCWGSQSGGRLGNGETTGTSAVPRRVQGLNDPMTDVSASWSHTCARRGDGALFCWGTNGFGELGTGNTTASSIAVAASVLPAASAVASGTAYGCLRLSNGRARCWGKNNSGVLGNGTSTNSTTPVSVLKADTTELPLITDIAIGYFFSCAVAGGKGYCWGQNSLGELGIGAAGSRSYATPIAGNLQLVSIRPSGSKHACARTTSDKAYCWGSNNWSQLGDSTQTDNFGPVLVGLPVDFYVREVGAGDSHSCALSSGGQVRCWGFNSGLGNGSTGIGYSSTPVVVQNIMNATQLSLSYAQACVVSNSSVWCWGGTNTVGTEVSFQ